MFLHYQECLFGYLGIVCQYVPGRKSSSSLLLSLLLLLPCSVLLLLACHCHRRRRSPSSGESSSSYSYSSSVQRLRNLISGTASSSLAMFRSVALLLRSDQVIIIIIIARRQTGLQMARSGCREARGHHLPVGFGFLRPPACQLSCCQSSCR
jgi:hypothetical protein